MEPRLLWQQHPTARATHLQTSQRDESAFTDAQELQMLGVLTILKISGQQMLGPAQWIAFVATGPDIDAGELGADDVGEQFNRKSLAGVMSGKQQRDVCCFGFEACVERRLACDQQITAVASSGSEERTGTSASDCNSVNALCCGANGVQSVNL
jgi:hypothetical protein